MRKPFLSTLPVLMSLFLVASPVLAGFELKPWTGGPTPPLSLLDATGKR